MMRFPGQRHALRLLSAASLLAALMPGASAQTAAPAASLIDQLVGTETPIAIDLHALKQQAAERIAARTDPQAARRPPLAPQLDKLPHFDFEVVFDPDSAIIRPQSYATIGRLADALTDPKLLPYAFLVVEHTEASGNRKENLALSQRRADSIRSVLSGTYKISAKRLFSLGLGEEQLKDVARPTSPANVRAQIITIGARPEDAPKPAAATAPAKKGPPAKKKRTN
jgi:outer membrane protein OmpA-like peptidoglycan-associated protein